MRGDLHRPGVSSALFAALLAGAAAAPAGAQDFEPQTVELTGTVRDFKRDHPDMQFRIATDPGIVEPVIGDDRKPVYTTSRTSTRTTNGKEFFDQWYRDVEGVNLSDDLTITLQNSPSQPTVFTFDDSSFFPIDGRFFGNQGMSHNYYFTFEIHSQFTYRGGETFSFRGDDDVFVFVNDRLVIDIGGVHGPIARTVSLDAVAEEIGLEVGGTYPLDFFFAERFCCGSNFRMQTSLVLEQPPEDPCGNGVLDAGEQCDDGNREDGDGCSAVCELEAPPPVALCQDATVFTDPGLCAAVAPVDAGSFDPGGGELALSVDPAPPYPLGATAASLTADNGVASSSCEGTVTVLDPEPPAASCNAPPALLGDGSPLSFTATASDNCQPPETVTVEVVDPTCFDDDLDDDGVPDDIDDCPGSDLEETLTIGECATGVENHLFVSGCTFSDLVSDCALDASNHGEFVSCVAHLTNGWRREGLINGREKGKIQSCAARSPIPEGSTGEKGVAQTTADDDPSACPAAADGATAVFPEAPLSGVLSWTVRSVDGSGNVATTECSVVLQNPVTPLPNQPPVADAGRAARVPVGASVTLDGSGSVDLDGDDLSFSWTLQTPSGSAAVLADPTGAAPTFVADVAGLYLAELTVSDGSLESDVDTVAVTAFNSRPVADAGPGAVAFAGETVAFDGSGSFDPDGDALEFAWVLGFRPEGSAAELAGASSSAPTLVPDVRGTYVAQLVVRDGELASPVDAAAVQVVNSPPVADAGPDQEISVFDTVELDGSGSSDLEGDPLAFDWTFVSVPEGSQAELSDPGAVAPTFEADLAGVYVLELVVSDGFDQSAADRVTITTVNTPPVADAGPDQTAFLGDPVTLDGTGSFDVDGDELSFQWTVVSRPSGSAAELSDPAASVPTFVPDVRGVYLFELTVHDGQRPSRVADGVRVDVVNRPPVADAGTDQTAFLGDTVGLDGTGSFDLDGDPLTFAWSFSSQPSGSTAALSDPAAAAPAFNPDVRGTYVLRLVVHDGIEASEPDTVTVTVPNRAPVADAGPDRAAFVGDTVFLDGSTSFDEDGDALTFSWSFVSVPEGSQAALSDPAAVSPNFEVDVFGTYVVELVVSDGELASDPDRVTVSTENSPPVADAGPDQGVLPGTTVTLDGSSSFDVDGDPLTFAWTLTTVPAGSAATLSDPAAPDPTFEADLAGTYLAELVVSDGELASDPDTVTIEATAALTTVPDLVGLDQDAAEAAILDADLVVGDVTLVASSTVPAGDVIDQDPPAGGTVATGTAVDLVVSSGPADDGTPPEASITVPEEDAVLEGRVEIVGTATDPALTGYDLAYAQVGSGEFVVFAESATPVVDGVLGVLDAALVPNGMFELRLRAFDPTGVATATRVVRVDTQKKVGNFTISFNDIVLPVAGIPITVTRTYDSTVKTREDFGVGWTLGVAQGDYANNRTPGEGWQILESGGFITLPCQQVQETLSHVTEIRLSQAETFLFKLDLVSPAAVLGGCQATARFVPLAGNLSASLEILGGTEVLYLNGTNEVVDPATLEPYEPTDVRLTTADGRVVTLDLAAGITAIRDTTGTGVTIGSGGVVHDSGEAIAFERDALGRITRITRPDGEFLSYSYDAAGDLVSVTDATGAATEFTYDSDHFLTDIVDARGVPLVRHEYDADGRLVATVDADGNRAAFEHDLAGNREVYRDRLGNLEVFLYDDDGNVISRTDALGNTTTSTYDADGNLLSETDPLGNTRTRTYDADGNLLSETDALGNTRSRTVHPLGVPLTETDALGNTTTHTYDADGNRLSTTDALGNTTTFTTDATGNVLTKTDALGFVTSRTYDAAGRETSVTDAEGNTVTTAYDPDGNPAAVTRSRTVAGSTVSETESFAYDAEGRVVSHTDFSGATTTTEYDAVGQIAARVDARGNRVELAYDFQGKLAEVRHPDGTTETFEHDAEGRKVASTDRAGRTTRFVRDAVGRVVETIHPDGAVESVAYDAAGRKVSETDANGNTTRFTYDAAGRLVAVTDPLGNVTERVYDAEGNKISETDANGHETRFEYDALGRMTAKVFPDGSRVTFTYDAAGNKIAETDQAGRTTTFDYDGLGRLIGVTDAAGGVTEYGYDEAGNRTSITDANGHATTVEYDGAGREVQRVLPMGQETVREYDAAGNLVRRVDATGDELLFEYDNSNRLIRRTLADGTVEETTYTLTGQVASRIDARGVTTFSYDARDRLVRQENPDGTFLEYTYDAAGNRTSITTPSGTTTYTYDALNRLASTTDPDGGVTGYAYDAVGNLAEVSHPNGTRTLYTYDTLNRLVRLETLRSDGGVIASYDYTLGPAGNRVRVVEATGRTVDYTYDALYRLVREEVTGPGATTIEYTYDAVGNRLTKLVDGTDLTSYTYDANDRLLAAGATTYGYDAAGNLTERTDASGTATFAYDALGRLIRATEGGNVVELAYDPDGHRVRRTVNGVVTRYLVDANREHAEVLEERDGAGAVVAAHTHGLELIRQSRGGAVSYYHHDGLGSVRTLTDPTEDVTDTYAYEAFGELVASTGSTPNDYLFTGEPLDPNVGFYYLRARWYDPAAGRFTSADVFPPDLFDPESLHRYVYVVNDPVNLVDPTGQFATVAGLSQTVTVTQMLTTLSPTLFRAGSIFVGVHYFYKPGFALRNLGLEMMAFPPPSEEAWEAALQTYQSGHDLIRLGSDFITQLDASIQFATSFAQVGLGIVRFANALRSVPRVTRPNFRIVGTRSLGGFGAWAGDTEARGINLMLNIQNGPTTTLIRAFAIDADDWSQVIRTGIPLLRNLQRLYYAQNNLILMTATRNGR